MCSSSAGAVDLLSSLYMESSLRISSLFLFRCGSVFGGLIGFGVGGFLLVRCSMVIFLLRSSELFDEMLALFSCWSSFGCVDIASVSLNDFSWSALLILSLTISTRRFGELLALCGSTTVLSDPRSWMACPPAAFSSIHSVSPWCLGQWLSWVVSYPWSSQLRSRS